MIPGLIKTLRPISASGSNPDGSRRLLSKPYAEKFVEELQPPFPSIMPSKAVRVFPMPIAQPSPVPRPHPPLPDVHDRVGVLTSGPNYCSSGSEHDPSSACLAAMVNDFMENEGSLGYRGKLCYCRDGPCGGKCTGGPGGSAMLSSGAEPLQLLQDLVDCCNDVETNLQCDVMLIMDSLQRADNVGCLTREISPDHSCVKRAVMKQLRKKKFNSGICKSRWDHSCGIPAGDYDYLDVLIEHSGAKMTERIIVDTDFRAQFEIARPTDEFSAFLELLPPVFVGKADRLQQIVHLMSEATKQSLRLKGLHLPPWRKLSYMNAKWFSPYKRTCSDGVDSCSKDTRRGAFAGIAVRGCGLDVKCTKELELLYHEAGARFQGRNGGCVSQDEITVFATDWQPPAIAPRALTHRSNLRSKAVTGLASLLLQAGLKKPHSSANGEEKLSKV